jgi:hypothetical protein
MTNWMRVEPSAQHHQEAARRRGVLLAVLETYLCYLHGRIDVTYRTERQYDLLERFVIRCLFELKPFPASKQIATLLGFQDERFISTVFSHLQANRYLEVGENGLYRITRQLQEDFARQQWIEQERREQAEFRYEWVTRTFLPEQMSPEGWERARQLPLETEVEVDEDRLKQWAQRLFRTRSGGTVRWEPLDVKSCEKWMSPLQVIVYTIGQKEPEWEIYQPFIVLRREQHQRLRSIVGELGIEDACQDLAKSG